MEKTIEQLFKECTEFPCSIEYKGKNIVGVDRFPAKAGETIKVVFESVNSKWEQAVRLKVDGELIIENEKGKNFILWSHNAPDETLVKCSKNKNEFITVYNAWDTGSGSADAWLGNAGMIVEELTNGRRYRCNDGYPDDDFDDLVFRIERVQQTVTS